MFSKFKSSLEQQAIFLAACIFLSGVVSYIFDFSPHIRLSWKMLSWGILGGVSSLIMVSLALLLGTLLRSEQVLTQLKETSKALSRSSLLSLLGAGITAGAGEELMLRGFVFAPLARQSLWAAFAASFILSVAAYWQGRKQMIWALGRGFEGTLYALMYLQFKSLFMIAVASFICEAGRRIALRSGKCSEILSAVIKWRKSGKLFKKGLRKLV